MIKKVRCKFTSKIVFWNKGGYLNTSRFLRQQVGKLLEKGEIAIYDKNLK